MFSMVKETPSLVMEMTDLMLLTADLGHLAVKKIFWEKF
jgi:hypothetical protein